MCIRDSYDTILGVLHDGIISEVSVRAHRTFSAEEIQSLEKELRDAQPTLDWIEKMYRDAAHLRERVK